MGFMKNTILQLIIVSLVSGLFFWLTGEAHLKLLKDFQITDRDCMFAATFIGAPIGGIFGLRLLKKLKYRDKKPKMFRIAIGLILSFVAGVFCLIALPYLGNSFYAILPILVSIILYAVL